MSEDDKSKTAAKISAPPASSQDDQDKNEAEKPAWAFRAEDDSSHDAAIGGSNAATKPPEKEVAWTASEFIVHHKTPSWYASLAGVVVLLSLLVYWFTRDKISTAIVIIVGIIFGISAGQKPRVLNYRLDSGGLHIQQKMYPYGQFKSFTVIDEGAFSSVLLLPLKRFMPAMAVYFDPKDQNDILNMLSRHLPFDPLHHDLIDRFLRRIRF